MDSPTLIDIEDQYGAHSYLPLDVGLQRGEGVWVYDVEGKRYLDCLSAYSALNHGHRHPLDQVTVLRQVRLSDLTRHARACFCDAAFLNLNRPSENRALMAQLLYVRIALRHIDSISRRSV